MKKWQKSLILVLAFAVAILGSAIVTMQLTYREQTPAEAKTAEIGAYLDRFFIDDYDEDTLADAAASAMVEATGDRWSYYLTAEEKSSYDEQMQNAYVGIGVTITAQEELGGMRIEAVTADGPAEEAGLLAGDIITEVEGEKTLDLGMTGTRTKVRGEEGTFVTLTILRGEESFPVSVERRSIQTPVATYEMLDGQIGYIKIANFDTRCAEETNAAMDELIAQDAKALIFDVRNNGGGYKNELVKVLDKILLSIVSLAILIAAGVKDRRCRSYGVCAAAALGMMLVGAVGTKLVPAQYFGAVERFSVFAATGFNAAPFRQAILRHWSAAYEAFYLKSGQ